MSLMLAKDYPRRVTMAECVLLYQLSYPVVHKILAPLNETGQFKTALHSKRRYFLRGEADRLFKAYFKEHSK